MNEWFKSISQSLIASVVYTLLVSAITGIGIKGWQNWKRLKRLKALRDAAPENAVGLCVRIGGRGNPLPDVEKHLTEHQPNIKALLYYEAPAASDLADPATALAILEDLREAITEYGRHSLTEIHFFPVGMVAYPFALGAMLSNWCTVVVYHLQEGKYTPLYRINKELIQRDKRTTQSLSRLQILPVVSRSVTANVLPASTPPTAVATQRIDGPPAHNVADKPAETQTKH